MLTCTIGSQGGPNKMAAAHFLWLHFLNNRSSIQSFFFWDQWAKSAKFVGCKIGDMRSRFRFWYPGILWSGTVRVIRDSCEVRVFWVHVKIWSLFLGVSKTQTSKTRTSDPKNSDPLGVSKTQTWKTQTLWVSRKLRPSGCLENSDPKNSDPLGVSKTQTLKIKQI